MQDVPALDIKDLHKTFGQNEVLKGISLSAHKGDVVSIIGSSGSGKSTFLRCINLLETPTAGEIWVNGELIQMKNNRQGVSVPVNEKQVQRIRSRLAMVFQGFNLWSHLTVLDNVIEAPVHVLGVPKAQAIENAELLLKKVGLYERKDYYPGHLSGSLISAQAFNARGSGIASCPCFEGRGPDSRSNGRPHRTRRHAHAYAIPRLKGRPAPRQAQRGRR